MPMHEPVMTAEVLGYLVPSRGGLFVDCTVGGGGHARALLESGASRVVGLDRDREALRVAAETLHAWRDRVDLVHDDYRNLEAVLDERGVGVIDGALADLGFSSLQLEGEGRGFSFLRDESLDMRMDRSIGPTAADLIRDASEAGLADIMFTYGEERHARRIARAVVEARRRQPIQTTGQLAAIIRRVVPHAGHARIHPATRTFQAFRIWVNRELEGLETFLTQVSRRLRTGARLVVIAFHSLEDRIVKHTLRALERSGEKRMRVLTKRPVTPRDEEIARNPRARSAKLRAAIREV